MMTRFLLTTLMISSAFAVSLPAYAQVTDQTDQSEEDWRKSRKKSGTTDIFKPNTGSIGSGAPVEYKPVSPVERLPSESRRHLMKERAKAIAESEDGDISDAEYVPSEAAKSDEDLMREEKEAWDVIVTDMKGSGGASDQPGQGENKVAVAGVGGGSSTGPRGGSTRTLQEIMDAIKNGGIGGGAGQGQSGNGQAPTGSPNGSGQTPSGTADGSGQSSDGEATQVADAGAASGGGSSDGAGQAGSGQSNGGQGDANASGGGQDGSGDQGGDAGDGSDAGRTAEPLSPLERMRRAREGRPATGTQRSASDYLGTSGDE